MEVVKAFQNDLEVTIRGTYEEPLFRSSDVGIILGIKNIHQNLTDFDSTEKVICIIDTPGGQQEVSFLTEKGLYQILFTSRKPIAKKFKDWVCEVIKEIRLNGKYDLEKQIKDTIKQKEQNLISNFSKKPILYIGLAEDNVAKPGYTDDIETRLKDLKKEIKPEFTFEYVYESVYNREIERRLFQHPILKSKRILKEYNGKIKTELFKLDTKFTIQKLVDIVLEIKNQVEAEEIDKNKNNEIDKLKAENAELKLEVENLKKINEEAHLKSIDMENNSMYNLYHKFQDIRKAMVYNFLIDFICRAIINDGTYNDFTIKLDLDEIFNNYKTYIMKHKFTNTIYDENSEKKFITNTFNKVSGIKNVFIGTTRARIFYVSKVAEWIYKNVNIIREYVGIIKKMVKNTYVEENYCEILNSELKDKELLKSSYSFLIHLIIKYKNQCGDKYEGIIAISDIIVREEYIKFMLQFDRKTRKITNMFKAIEEVNGVSYKKTWKRKKVYRVLYIVLEETLEWIDEFLEISEEFSEKLHNKDDKERQQFTGFEVDLDDIS
jgi:prophage antirepressor-like protein